MGCICWFLSCITCKACRYFWCSQTCGDNLCSTNCSIGSSATTWYILTFFHWIHWRLLIWIWLVLFPGDNSSASKFSFFSSFQSNLLSGGLGKQVGWGHVWNRFAGRLSCHNQPHQCARTPLLPPAWWDAALQSPISRDIRRLQAYGVYLMDSGEVSESHLQSFCQSRKDIVKTMSVFHQCQNSKCSWLNPQHQVMFGHALFTMGLFEYWGRTDACSFWCAFGMVWR